MSLREDLLNKVVRPELQQSVLHPTTGIVRTVYPGIMKLDVWAKAPWTGELTLLHRIPYLLTAGVAAPLPVPGDEVTLIFQGNTMQSAVAVAWITDRYDVAAANRLAHPDKGAYVPDCL